MPIVLQNSSLLNQYYDQRALSSLPNQEPFFQFGLIDWGYDLIEIIDGKPSAQEIDLDMKSIANVFHTSKATYSYINGNIVITASIPAGKLTEQVEFSCVGIKDTNGNLIAVAVDQPVWLHADRVITIEIVINTARTDKTKISVRQ